MSSLGVVDQAVALVAAARELVAAPWGEVGAGEVLEVTAAVASVRGLVDAALLHAAGRVEVTGAAQSAGWAGTKEFLTHVTGGGRGEGGGLMRVVQRLGELPAVREALLRLAVGHGIDATGIHHAVADVIREVDPEGRLCDIERGRARAERTAHLQRHAGVFPDQRGGAWIKGYGTLEEAEEIRQVLLAHAAPVPAEPGSCGGDPLRRADGSRDDGTCMSPGCDHTGRDPRDGGARMWDALVTTARIAAASPASPDDHGVRPVLMVTADADQLAARIADSELVVDLDHGRLPHALRTPDARLIDGTPISVHALRRLACDALVLPAVLGGEGQVLDVGRSRRLVSRGMWLALVLRDRQCVFPGCTRPPSMGDAHHVVHWADGGVTSLDNLVLLCRHHHRFIHASPWEVVIDPETRRPRWIPPPGRPRADPRIRPTQPPHAA